MKICIKCKQAKPISEFDKNRSTKDGLQGCCKSCKKAFRKQYHRTPNGRAVHRKEVAKYQQTPNGKATMRRATAKYNARNPNYRKAHNAVNNAITAGKLSHPDCFSCYYCPKPAQQYHHWQGYEPEHWLDVVPACKECHTKLHNRDKL